MTKHHLLHPRGPHLHRPSPQGMGRRSLLGMGAAGTALLMAGAARAQAVPPNGELTFNLIREGEKIGHETVAFETSGSKMTVFVDASIRVTMAMVTVFRLHHHETETWDNGQLLSFAATTEKNGRNFYAQGWRVNDAFMVRGTANPGGYQAPSGALPTSQWNHAMLQGPMINTQDGRLMRPVVTSHGITDVVTAEGAKIPARHFAARGDLHFDTFFTDAWEWVGLSFKADDGSLVTYEKV
jgi:hypothetical protein